MRTWLMQWRRLRPALAIVITAALVVGMVMVVSGMVAARRGSPAAPAATGATATTGASLWRTLEAQPLRLAQLAAGQSCVATATQSHISPDYGAVVGSGPAYVVGGAATGILTYVPPALFSTGQGATQGATPGANSAPALGGTKVRWQIAPTYTGPVLIRGRQLNGPNQLYFNGGLDQPNGNALGTEPVLSQLRLMGGGASGSSWPTWITLTRVAQPGCYAYQVDGASFSYTITFQAVSELG